MKILITYPGLEPFIEGTMLAPGIIESEKSSLLAKKEVEEIKKIHFKELKDLIKKIKEVDLKNHLVENFTVTCTRTSQEAFTSQEIKVEVVKAIVKKYGLEVDHKNPKTVVHLEIVGQLCLVTLSSLKESGKRRYKVRSATGSISAPLANALLDIAKIKPKEILFDPFCKDGTLAIEAKLRGIEEVYISDPKTTSVYSAKVNATIAQVTLQEGQPKKIDKIITILPSPSKRRSESSAKKLIESLPPVKEIVALIQKPEILNVPNREVTQKAKVLIGNDLLSIVIIK